MNLESPWINLGITMQLFLLKTVAETNNYNYKETGKMGLKTG
jgi:hypothetical protein